VAAAGVIASSGARPRRRISKSIDSFSPPWLERRRESGSMAGVSISENPKRR
jgi:hypothetical protein